jgi:hypothetical protein
MKNTENRVATTITNEDTYLDTRLKKHRNFWGSKLTPAENEIMERHIEFLREQ